MEESAVTIQLTVELAPATKEPVPIIFFEVSPKAKLRLAGNIMVALHEDAG